MDRIPIWVTVVSALGLVLVIVLSLVRERAHLQRQLEQARWESIYFMTLASQYRRRMEEPVSPEQENAFKDEATKRAGVLPWNGPDHITITGNTIVRPTH